ncbi:hypothetical protein DFH07DRAFT_761131 [Mycena maculata]|uniref:SET domain-containing protein n=1 Tax=Mycena maculata TaxID=230809 RepID=A0AAD7HF91_9AGAR|nr:hypothetical protein DFH07DRAFT_761131 [Mycena maculata]
MNADIRANPALDSPYFDLAGHIGSRAYCMDNIYHDGPDDTATLLDVGVQALLPTPIPAPPNRTPKGPTFDIRQSEGKRGLGMFAAQNIPAGGLIVVERPVLVVPYIIAIQTYTESELYAALLGRLSPDTVARFLVLSNCKPASECDAVEGIMRTNAIGITLEVPDGPHPELPTHRAIFLNVSRCNHSCGPNAVWHWDATSFSLSLEALRPIEAGQEITVAYITPTHSRAERRARLKMMYNFSCRCEFCARPAIAVSKSDAMRAELRAFWDAVPSFEAWCLDARMPDHALIDAHKRAILLIEAEGLQTLDYGKHLDAIAMGYGALQDVEQFRAWMWHARDARPVGRDDAARVMQKWINDPESFPVWGWRKSLQRRRKD